MTRKTQDEMIELIRTEKDHRAVAEAIRQLEDKSVLSSLLPGNATITILEAVAEAETGLPVYDYLRERGELEAYLPLVLSQEPAEAALDYLMGMYVQTYGELLPCPELPDQAGVRQWYLEKLYAADYTGKDRGCKS